MADAARSDTNWFQFAAEYVEIKWPDAWPKHRQGIAEALTNATMALFRSQRGKPADVAIRKAYRVMSGLHLRERTTDETTSAAIRWLKQNTLPVSDLATPDVLRAVM